MGIYDAHPKKIALWLVDMGMVRIGEVRMVVRHPVVAMPVTVSLLILLGRIVLVLVVFVMDMFVLMFQRFVRMDMRVLLGQMQPHANRHQRTGQKQAESERLAHQQCQQCAKERGHRKIGPGACGAEVPQGQHEQGEAQSIGQHADQHGTRYAACSGPGRALPCGQQQIDAVDRPAFRRQSVAA